MVKPKKLHILLFVLVVLSGIACLASMVEARKTSSHHQAKSRDHSSHCKKSKGSKSGKTSPGHGRHAPSPSVGPHGSRVFDVLSFGAIGDGVSDDSKALEAAWEAACKVTSATLEIPSEFKFLVNPVTLQGPCMPGLVLHIDGSLLAPPNLSSWSKSSYFQWINFKWLEDFTIRGSGNVNGQGSSWWNLSSDHHLLASRFYGSHNLTVEDITIVNSQYHLKFDDCEGVKVDNITISSPEKSPNTDGIHLVLAGDRKRCFLHGRCRPRRRHPDSSEPSTLRLIPKVSSSSFDQILLFSFKDYRRRHPCLARAYRRRDNSGEKQFPPDSGSPQWMSLLLRRPHLTSPGMVAVTLESSLVTSRRIPTDRWPSGSSPSSDLIGSTPLP